MNQLPFEQLKDYENQWVALLEPDQTIVGNGKDAVEATKAAEKKGYKDVTLFYVPRFDSYFIGGYGV